MMRPPTSARRATGESGFTLLELMVTLVLLALAMAAIFPAIGNMYRNNGRSAASSQAVGEAGIAARLLESDVRAALGDRGTGERVMTSTTTLAVRIATIPALNGAGATQSMADIRQAGPTRLYINADVVPTAGIERVEWELLQDNATCGDRDRATNRNFCLQRRVFSSAGAILSTEVPVRGRGAYPTGTRSCGSGTAVLATARVFCFQEAVPNNGNASDYVWNSTWNANCSMRWNQVGPGTSPNNANVAVTQRIPTLHNAVEGPTSISRLDRIVAVGAKIIAGGGYGKAGERTYEHVETAIRARESEAYREAIMCGTRAGWGR
jgi:prepilin-type N-terminal cleavage/methylation domain-containing protein